MGPLKGSRLGILILRPLKGGGLFMGPLMGSILGILIFVMGLHHPQVVARLRKQMKPSGRRCTFVARQLSKKQLGIEFGI